MKESVFGWSYPPGCSGPPDDDPYCSLCGQSVDGEQCICPECPVCGQAGAAECYQEHGMILSNEQIAAKAKAETAALAEAQGEAAFWARMDAQEETYTTQFWQ